MVNYGYGPDTQGWKEERKAMLAKKLSQLLLDMKLTRNKEISSGLIGDHEFPEPYVEVDGLYAGVRVRKITALTESQQDELIRRCEDVYKEVMWN